MNANQNDLGQEYWPERPACAHEECTAAALSYAKYCWNHLPDPTAYVEELARRAATINGLAGLNLAGVRWKSAAAPRANFVDARLAGADFSAANLAGADFSGADLAGATFRGADLTGAKFVGADLSFANLRGANLTHAEVRFASLAQSDLTNVRLVKARLEETDLSGASLAAADLRGASVRRCSLARAQLAGATFAGARLESCDLAGAEVADADFFGVLFGDTDVGRAHLPRGVMVVNERLGKWQEAAEVYAALKLNFRQYGRFAAAEEALYREMVARRRARLANGRTWRPLALVRDFLDFVFLDLYAGYGVKPWRVARALVVAWLGFAFYYYLLPFFGRMGRGLVSYVDAGGNVGPITDLSWASFQRCLYYSFITLTKLGFSAYEPYGWAKVAAALEGSFAIVSFIVLLVAVARKIWR